MSVKKCPKCGSVWYSELPKCAFCGVEGEALDMPILTGKLHGERPAEVKSTPKPQPVESPVAVAEATPVPPTRSDLQPEGAAERSSAEAPGAPAVTEERPGSPEAPAGQAASGVPPSAPAKEPPEQVRSKRPAPSRLEPAAAWAPQAPRLPSFTVPLVFGILGLAAWLLLPFVLYYREYRLVNILGPIAWALLVPFAPFAWFAGQRYEERCRVLGFKPASPGRVGRLVGMFATFVVILELALFAVLVAAQRIGWKPPSAPPG